MKTTDAMIDFDKIDRDVRRLRAEASAEMFAYLKTWIVKRMGLRKSARPAAKPAHRAQAV